MNGPERDARRDEIEAEFAAFSAEADRAAARDAVTRAMFELRETRAELGELRVNARSAVRRTALTDVANRIDARLRALATEYDGLA